MKKSMVYGTPSQAAFDSPNRFESMKKEHETRTITNRKFSNYTQLSAFYCLSFTFKFETPHDTTKMAYSPPFLYSQLDPMIKELENV